MVWRSRGGQTLRTVWFRDPEAPKPYAQYGLAIRRRLILTHSMLWRPRGVSNLCRIEVGDPDSSRTTQELLKRRLRSCQEVPWREVQESPKTSSRAARTASKAWTVQPTSLLHFLVDVRRVLANFSDDMLFVSLGGAVFFHKIREMDCRNRSPREMDCRNLNPAPRMNRLAYLS